MRNLILLFILSSNSLIAQSDFALYFKPVIGLGFSTSISGIFNDGIVSYPELPTPYFTHNAKNIMISKYPNLGLDIGIKYKRSCFEFQYLYSSVGVGFHIKPFEESYNVDKVRQTSYLGIHKLSFGYSIDVLSKEQFSIRFTSNFGFNFRPDVKAPYQFTTRNYLSDLEHLPIGEGAVLNKLEYKHIFHRRYTPFVSIGLGCDLFTKTKKPLFSIDLSYTQGFKPMNSGVITYEIEDASGIRQYSFNNGGRGSMICLNFSRRFNFSNFKKNK